MDREMAKKANKSKAKLSDKQLQFVKEYLIDFNGKQAAIRAGYSVKTAEVQACKMLRLPKVREELKERQKLKDKEIKLNAQYVIKGLIENVKRSMQKEAVLDKEGEPIGVYKYEGSVANRALELLGKHLGMFSDKLELTGKDGGPVTISMLDDMTDEELEAIAFGDGDE